jgi:hypothetical protein
LLTRVTIDGARRERVRVHLDSRTLQIGGRPSLAVALSGVQALDVRGSELRLATPDGIFEIELGDQAATWAAKIRSPPSRAQKLGLAAGLRVALVGLEDAELKAEVSAAGARRAEPGRGVDLVFVGAETSDDLASLPRLVEQLAPAGALWVVRRKGPGAALAEADVRAAARAAGLVDVKVVAFSETHAADKFVFPVSARAVRALAAAGKKTVARLAGRTGKRATETPTREQEATRLAAPQTRAAKQPTATTPATSERSGARQAKKPAAAAPTARKRAPAKAATEKQAAAKPAAKKRAAGRPAAKKRATQRR